MFGQGRAASLGVTGTMLPHSRCTTSHGPCRLRSRCQDEQTPLHIASRLGKPDIVQQLLHNGASPDATTTSGYTPLHLAAREGHKDVASVLLDQGASLGITTKVREQACVCV